MERNQRRETREKRRFLDGRGGRWAETTGSGDLEKERIGEKVEMCSVFEERLGSGREQLFSPGESTISEVGETRKSARSSVRNSIQLVMPQHLTAIAQSLSSFRNRLGAVNKRKTRTDRDAKRRNSLPEKRLLHFDTAAERLPEAPKLPKWHTAGRGRFA